MPCGKQFLGKNEVGINKKLLGAATTTFFCMDCLADYLDVTARDIEDKIEELKEQG